MNTVIFFWWSFGSDPLEPPAFMVNHFLVSWEGLAQGRYWTLLTSVFSHNLLFHFLMNMLVLNSFGPIVERVLGRGRFLILYVVAGLISSLSHALVSALILGQPDLPALGASGAISGIIMLFSLWFPREKILLLGLLPIPAFLGAFVFVGLDLWGLWAQAAGGGLPIGHGAHLGGALVGILGFFYFRKNLSNIK